MRHLSLIRHAKSSWDDPSLSDFERPLNDRGRRDAPVMARRAALLAGRPHRWVSSPAVRAWATARAFAETLGVPMDLIEPSAAIYDAHRSVLIDLVRQLDDAHTTVWLFGHNPGLSELGLWLCRQAPQDMPTCAVAQYSLAIPSWSALTEHSARLRCYLYPKQHLD